MRINRVDMSFSPNPIPFNVMEVNDWFIWREMPFKILYIGKENIIVSKWGTEKEFTWKGPYIFGDGIIKANSLNADWSSYSDDDTVMSTKEYNIIPNPDDVRIGVEYKVSKEDK